MYVVEALPDDPRTARGAMLVLMARIAADGVTGPIQLRATESFNVEIRRRVVTYTALVGGVPHIPRRVN